MAKKSKSRSSLKKKSSFSHFHFVIYVLAFALIGVATLWISFAAPPGPCTANAPTVGVQNSWAWASPGSWGLPGQQRQFQVDIINQDANCASSTFTLSVSVPSGFSLNLPANSISIKSGGVGYLNMDMTSPSNATDGDYPLTFSATRNGSSAAASTASAVYKVYSTDTTAPKLGLNNPYDGQVISSKGKNSSSFNFTTVTTDDHSVKHVDTYIDGALVNSFTCGDITYSCQPYFAWSLRGQTGQHSVTWKAYDWLGNVGTLSANFSVQ